MPSRGDREPWPRGGRCVRDLAEGPEDVNLVEVLGENRPRGGAKLGKYRPRGGAGERYPCGGTRQRWSRGGAQRSTGLTRH